MAEYVWLNAEIRDDDVICLGDGRKHRTFLGDGRNDFLKKAGKNGKVLLRNDWIQLFYNAETGDIFIPKQYSMETIRKIKKTFLRFISRDDHEDVPYKTVEIED